MKLTENIQKAINLATEKHQDQFRKGDKLPYIVHPFSVAWMLADAGETEEVVVAGLLHDILEDVPGYSYEQMKQEFGERVATIVKDVSEDKDPNVESDERATWEERKQKYLDHLRNASNGALCVSVADKIHNLRSMKSAYQTRGEDLWKEFNSPPEKKLWFYEEVLKIAEEKTPGHVLTNGLKEALQEMKKQLEQTAEQGLEKFATAEAYMRYKDKENEDMADAAIKGMKEGFAERDAKSKQAKPSIE